MSGDALCDDVGAETVSSVVDLARDLGLVVEEPVTLRSTNNLVLWLRPSPVVAKISSDETGSAAELAVARMLADGGAPIVHLAQDIERRVHRAGGHSVTFWRYEPQNGISEPKPDAVAHALADLHSALGLIDPRPLSRTFDEQITAAGRALDRPGFAPEMASDDRRLLGRALDNAVAGLRKTADMSRIIHGSPHRLNIVVVGGSPAFIDFETVARGPVEWDLAHLEPAVAGHYPGKLDPHVLATCRVAVSAVTSTWCWDGVHRAQDMKSHAEYHLACVRSGFTFSEPYGSDTTRMSEPR